MALPKKTGRCKARPAGVFTLGVRGTQAEYAPAVALDESLGPSRPADGRSSGLVAAHGTVARAIVPSASDAGSGPAYLRQTIGMIREPIRC